MKLRLKEDPGEWVKFIVLNAGVIGALLTLLWWRHLLPGHWLARGLEGLLLVVLLCLIQPRWFRGVYRFGMRASHRLGQFTSAVLLTVFFLVVLTPLGWVLRLAGKDLLRLKRDPQATTYWHKARPPNPLERLF